jgi:putative peptidoglycan lipid II flippase
MFYAMGRSRIPVAVSVGSVLVNVALNVLLVRFMGYRGLALGTSLAALINAGTQLLLLRREIGGIEGRRVMLSLAKVLLASMLMAGAAWGADVWMTQILPGTTLMLRVTRVAVAIGAGLAVLAASATVLRVTEFEDARDLVIGRLRRIRR